jgi:hypothetical protein
MAVIGKQPQIHRLRIDKVNSLLKCLERYQQSGWVEIVTTENGDRCLKLSDPEGLLFSNVILTEIFSQHPD